jgi:hypothetical protein
MPTAFDLQQFYNDVEARLKTATPTPKTVGTADDFADAMNRAAELPAVFVLYKGSTSKGRLTPGSKIQMRDPLKLFLAIVAKSLMNQKQGHLAIAGVLQPWERWIAGWKPTWATRPFIFNGDYFVMRDGPKVVYGVEFHAAALEFIS